MKTGTVLIGVPCVCGCKNDAAYGHRGLSHTCYERYRRRGWLNDVAKPSLRPRDRVCSTPGCKRKHKRNGFCDRCYMRVWRWAAYEPSADEIARVRARVKKVLAERTTRPDRRKGEAA